MYVICTYMYVLIYMYNIHIGMRKVEKRDRKHRVVSGFLVVGI